MSVWSILLSSSQQRLTLPAQNQSNLMGMIHRGWRPKFTFGKMWECVWEILSVVWGLVTHQQHVFLMTRAFSITPSQKCLQTSWCRRKCYLSVWIDRCNKWLGTAIRFLKFVLWHHAWSFNGILDWGGYECQHSCSCLALSALKKTRTVESFHSSHATAGEAPLCADLKHQGTQTRLLAKTENSRQNTLVHNSSILLSLHLWRSWGESSPNTMLTSQYYNWEQMLPKWHSIWWVMNEITLSCLIDEVVSISLYL